VAENKGPPPGVAGRVVTAIVADPALSEYVRSWVSKASGLEATLSPIWPPIDASYERVRDLLRRAGDHRRRSPASYI
jgi:hypothetical protein